MVFLLALVVAAVFVMGKRENATRAEEVKQGALVLEKQRAAGIHPSLWDALMEWERSGPFPVMVGYKGGLRTMLDQLALYAQGRTTPGEVVTDAKEPLYTPHGRGAAVDLWPVNPDGRPSFDTTLEDGRYQSLAAWFRERGFRTALRISSGTDWPHIELPSWRELPYPPPNYNTGG